MMNRRFRGMLSLAGVWGTALAALSTSTLVIGLVSGLVPRDYFPPAMIGAVALRGLVIGALSGGLFAWFLSVRERDRAVATLSMKRAALWGFASAAVVPLLMAFSPAGAFVPMSIAVVAAGIAGVGGGLFGAGLLRVAQRDDRKLAGAVDQTGKLQR